MLLIFILYILYILYKLSISWDKELELRKTKIYSILQKKYNGVLTDDRECLIGYKDDDKILFKFYFSNYPNYKLSSPINQLDIYFNISKYSEDEQKKIKIRFNVEKINEEYWIVSDYLTNKRHEFYLFVKPIKILINNSKQNIESIKFKVECYLNNMDK
ncbi:hypothetical protein [Chishuiella sp.]|uniref:hypothetical protein n=1 Tax=Chishuiella sp. TaxID=1969467 RepID=UPI0028AFAD62|nr:hypothetical protein [Chishuiella sp.]